MLQISELKTISIRLNLSSAFNPIASAVSLLLNPKNQWINITYTNVNGDLLLSASSKSQKKT